MNHSRGASRRWARAAAVLAAGTLAFTGHAAVFADDISNNLDATIDAVAEVMPLTIGGSNGSTQLYVSPSNGDGKNGCNLTGSTELHLSIASSNTAVASVSPGTVTFGSCGDTRTLTVTPVGTGTATISATQTSNTTDGTFDLAPVTFTVNVSAPPNTAPTVAVLGVTGGASYAKGSVPAATCQVTDAEDGPSSFAAPLGDVMGPYSVDGIGSQTATCSYTDSGGLTATSSETYLIIDPSAPVIGYTLTPIDGDNGWHRGDATLTWSVSEPQSPSSLGTTGCQNQAVTADQVATTYSCSATSAGGSAEQVDVSIKRDGTRPVVTGTVVSPSFSVGGTTWYKDSAQISWDATDATSGVATGPTPTSSTRGEGWMQEATSEATDNAGNAGNGSVPGINVDASAPQVSATITSSSPYNDGTDDWFKDSVSINVTANDPNLSDGHTGSGLAQDPSGVKTRTSSGSETFVATDNVGHETTSNRVSYRVDATDPVVNISCPTGPVVKGSSASAGWSASDTGSGLATALSGTVALDTSAIGSRTATAPTARDNVGHSANKSCSYSVVYDWTGFFRPIDNGDVLNSVKAGSAVPVKFSLAGNQGLNIFAAGFPKSAVMPCDPTASVDAVEETVTAGNSSLSYDPVSDQYNYVWKTDKSWVGTCRQLTVTLIDGTSKSAKFKLLK